MAILSKIRDRSMFLIIIIGLALFSFVLDPSAIQSFFSSGKVNSIGEINGESIDREEFGRAVESYKSRAGRNVSQMQAVNAVWNNMVSEGVFKTQLEEAGIVIGEKDLWDAMMALPSVQGSPLFKNEIGLFDEEKLKEYVATLRDDAKTGDKTAWNNWLATEKSIQQNLERKAYTSLVKVGLGASLKSGERDYFNNNTTVNASFVYVPYTSVSDSLVSVSNSDIASYIKENKKKYNVDASRNLNFVKFDIIASKNDEDAIKATLSVMVNDREEYSAAAKGKVNIPGFKNATDDKAFVEDSKSDLSYDGTFRFQNELPSVISNEVFEAETGAVVGPFKHNGYFKLSKVSEVIMIPDSVKASHILISFAGAASSSSLVSEADAKKTVDSLLKVVKGNKAKFTEIAKTLSSDLGSGAKGGDLDWFTYSTMTPKFRDFCFENKTNDIDVVKTVFGFHIIRIDAQNEKKKAVKLATVAKLIEASEETENIIFEKAETLASQLAEGKNINDLAKESGYNVQMAVGLKVLGENVTSLGSQRQMVSWAFDTNRLLNDSNRFDVDVNGKMAYAVVSLTGITKKGLAPVAAVINEIRPILMNRKKAAILLKRMNGETLSEIAKENNTAVRNATAVTIVSPTLVGVGNEPAIVGAMSTLELNKVEKGLVGNKGVFAVEVTKRELPATLENYGTFRNTLVNKVQNRTGQLYNVLKEASQIEDYRGQIY
ncbi:MAG: peptidylprolyl isomerase [Flavobacteriaceae bacterium]|nr:MAG: peptidylprolyl isomerase [Flavobacteriaceae bacterium]